MIYYLINTWQLEFPGANLFNYITFRAGGAVMTALVISFLLGPWMIEALRARQGKGQPIREDGPQSHLITKVGTPTMGGLLILLASIGSTFDMGRSRQCVFMDCAAGYGRFWDDWLCR